MAPWIASVRADNAIELRHRELHQNTLDYILPFHVSDWKLQLQMSIAQWKHMYVTKVREVGVLGQALPSTRRVCTARWKTRRPR